LYIDLKNLLEQKL